MSLHEKVPSGKGNAAIYLVCYEALCAQPGYWEKLCTLAKIPAGVSVFRLANQPDVAGIDHSLFKRASEIYDELVSLNQFIAGAGKLYHTDIEFSTEVTIKALECQSKRKIFEDYVHH